MQYYFMVAFCWMLVEGIYLYFFVVKVYNVSQNMNVYHVLSWGEDNQLHIVTYFYTLKLLRNRPFIRAGLFTHFRSCAVTLEDWFLQML